MRYLPKIRKFFFNMLCKNQMRAPERSGTASPTICHRPHEERIWHRRQGVVDQHRSNRLFLDIFREAGKRVQRPQKISNMRFPCIFCIFAP